MEIKLKINNGADRERMVTALANSGYRVCVIREKQLLSLYNEDFYVCFEIKEENFLGNGKYTLANNELPAGAKATAPAYGMTAEITKRINTGTTIKGR